MVTKSVTHGLSLVQMMAMLQMMCDLAKKHNISYQEVKPIRTERSWWKSGAWGGEFVTAVSFLVPDFGLWKGVADHANRPLRFRYNTSTTSTVVITTTDVAWKICQKRFEYLTAWYAQAVKKELTPRVPEVLKFLLPSFRIPAWYKNPNNVTVKDAATTWGEAPISDEERGLIMEAARLVHAALTGCAVQARAVFALVNAFGIELSDSDRETLRREHTESRPQAKSSATRPSRPSAASPTAATTSGAEATVEEDHDLDHEEGWEDFTIHTEASEVAEEDETEDADNAGKAGLEEYEDDF
jgi:hypothetical protein